MPHSVNVSVRNMVEFILRSGSIDAQFFRASRAPEGIKTHQRVQKLRKKEANLSSAVYKSEVQLKITVLHRDILFTVDGRADGIFTDGNSIVVEEIKSTLSPPRTFEKNTDHWHWAQAKCYGYMYVESLRENVQKSGNVFTNEEGVASPAPPDEITIAIIYAHIETNETVSHTETFKTEYLANFFYSLIDKYWDFADMESGRINLRNETARALAFPYDGYRKGQRELAVSVFTAVRQKKKLFAQAPTGIGKTISTLYPAVKSIAEGNGSKIFYLTAKVAARQVAEEALVQMLGRGLQMRSLTVTARDKICFNAVRKCNPEDCAYAAGHFDRVNEAIKDCVTNERVITRTTVESYARRHNVCPAEFQLDVSLFADAVVCDYNHVYDPKAKLQRFFQFGGDYILLNDEAHNLIDRAREMFSAGLYRADFSAYRKKTDKKHPLKKIISKLIKTIKETCSSEDKNPFTVKEKPENLLSVIFEFAEEADIYFQYNQDTPQDDELLTLYFNSLDFLRVSELFDDRYATYIEPANGYIKLFCLDPSYLLAAEQKKSRACVFFSATLTPLAYFKNILGGGTDDYTLKLASPFPRENLCLVVDDRVSTKYKDRSRTYGTVADRLHDFVSGKKGNYLAFFPSYAYLAAVLDIFAEKYQNIRTLVQAQEMDDENRQSYLNNFCETNEDTMLAFAVMGGAFSEGIDLKGERLIGAAIVGVGLPLISEERNVISSYYNRYSDNGFAFAYQYPGMNKVLQAAGRVIRSETDRGVVMLLDTRYNEDSYKNLFPPEWNGFARIGGCGSETLVNYLQAFWA